MNTDENKNRNNNQQISNVGTVKRLRYMQAQLHQSKGQIFRLPLGYKVMTNLDKSSADRIRLKFHPHFPHEVPPMNREHLLCNTGSKHYHM